MDDRVLSDTELKDTLYRVRLLKFVMVSCQLQLVDAQLCLHG